jgi:hypothetical protein
MAEGLRKMNQRGCGRKPLQSTELEYYPDTSGKHGLKIPYNIQRHRARIRAESS